MDTVAQSKLLSLILRHSPETAGLSLGPGGWVGVEDLLAGLGRLGKPLTRPELERLVAGSDKKRFTLSEDGARIRAAQGHSVTIEVDLAPAVPPETLYHGTAEATWPAIAAQGLRPMARLHVHLSRDAETALKVGRRHGRPLVLTVRSGEMTRAGHTFFEADNGVWLTPAVPPTYLTREGS